MDSLFCSKCGGRLEVQTIGDRPREVCPACGTIFYQNPLPAAAALVLDAERRVLLVRRRFKPNKGMWCLPIGFAELGGRVVGEIPQGLPSLTLPPLEWRASIQLLPTALVIAMISFMEAMASAKVIAMKTRVPLDINCR